MSRFTLIAAVIIVTFSISIPSWAISDRLTVVASVFPLFDFAREVAGSAADVRLLLPPGVDPHSWEPKPSDIVDLSRADIFLYTSDKMEPWAGSIGRAVKGRNIVILQVMSSLGFNTTDKSYKAAGAGETVKDHGEDPHFWLDLSLSGRAAQVIGQTLIGNDPGNRDSYASRALEYAGQLEKLDQAFKEGLEDCDSRKLVTGGHAAFGHLARRYDLEQVSVYGLSPDAEPSPRHLAGIVNLVRENSVRTVFSEEMMNPRMAQVLSQETGTKVRTLNPGANLTVAQWRSGVTFFDLMRKNLDTLKEGLGCE